MNQSNENSNDRSLMNTEELTQVMTAHQSAVA